MEPIEHVPGGWYEWYGTVRDVIDAQDALHLDFIHTEVATFIPTVSSLDLFTNNQLIDLSSFAKDFIY